MATVTTQNLSNLHQVVSVSVTPDDYQPAFNLVLKDYAKKANIPGFRKGMVPTGLIKKMYGPALYNEEVIKTVEKELVNYLKAENLNIFGQPLPVNDFSNLQLDCNNPINYTLDFEIGVRPTITLPNFATVTLPLSEVIITNDMLEKEVAHLQKQYSTKETVTEIGSEGNVIDTTLTACDDNGNIIEGAVAYDATLQSSYFTPVGLQSLIGKKVGDTLTITLGEAFDEKDLPNIYSQVKLPANVEGNATAKYLLEIEKIEVDTPMPIGEELFKKAFPNNAITTETELNERLTEDLKSYWQSQTQNELYNNIYKYLIENTTLQLPDTFLQKWMETGRDKKYTSEEVQEEYPSFKKGLGWSLISDEICINNNIEVTKEEIKNYAHNQVLQYMGMQLTDSMVGWINDYANKMMNDKKYVEEAHNKIQLEKLFGYVATQIKTNVTPIDVEDFIKKEQEVQGE